MGYGSFQVLQRRTRLLFRRRVQYAGALILGSFLPYAVRVFPEPELRASAPIILSAVLNAIVAFIALNVMRQMTSYPGYRGALGILPALLLPYAGALLFFVFLKLDYSRLVLLGGMLLSFAWVYGLAIFYSRKRRLKIGIVPEGKVSVLPKSDGIQWSVLDSDSTMNDLNALSADFRTDLSPHWERFVTEAALSGVPVYHVKDLVESITGRVRIDHLSENNLGSLVPAHNYLDVKAAVDFVGALLAGAILTIPLFIVGLMIRLDSKGPALFRQTRIGFRGQPFTMYKFRTMYLRESDEDCAAAAQTRDNDMRVTRFGRWLRDHRIDELPQIINVLRGEMSWIGPRPEAAPLSRWYEKELPFYRYRHIVRPGLSGWAQVNQGHVTDVSDVRSKLEYDFYYVKNFSPWLDGVISLKTVKTILFRTGSR